MINYIRSIGLNETTQVTILGWANVGTKSANYDGCMLGVKQRSNVGSKMAIQYPADLIQCNSRCCTNLSLHEPDLSPN